MIKRKVFLASLLCLSLVFIYSIGVLGSLAASDSSIPTVTLVTSNGQAGFTINRSDDKLFDDFTGAMPGDTLTKTIRVESASGNSGDFNIYLYAVLEENQSSVEKSSTSKKSSSEFLNAMSMSVKNKASTELKVLNTNTSNSKGVLLGSFKPGDSDSLTISFTLPLTMGNDFQDAESILAWHFYAEQVVIESGGGSITPYEPAPSTSPSPTPTLSPTEIPDEDTPTGDLPTNIGTEPVPIGDSPQTGDNSQLLFWIIMMVGSGSAISIILIFGRNDFFKNRKKLVQNSSKH